MKLTFESSVKADDKGRLERHEDVLLVENMSLLLVLDNTLFLDALECVRPVFNAFNLKNLHSKTIKKSASNLDELDNAESSGADGSEHLHVIESAIFQSVVHLSRGLVAGFGDDFIDALGIAELADETVERVSVYYRKYNMLSFAKPNHYLPHCFEKFLENIKERLIKIRELVSKEIEEDL